MCNNVITHDTKLFMWRQTEIVYMEYKIFKKRKRREEEENAVFWFSTFDLFKGNPPRELISFLYFDFSSNDGLIMYVCTVLTTTPFVNIE